MEKLFEYYRKLVRETDIEFYRYIYSKINWNSRMIGQKTFILPAIASLIWPMRL